MFLSWENIKKWLFEWVKTFSNEDSFLSSKRMSRFIFEVAGLALTIFVVIYNRGKFSASDNLLVITPLFGYAGYGLTKTEKEKTLINQTNGTDTNKNE
jgi:hypothetical protein